MLKDDNMGFLSKLEKKIGKYAIPNLSLIIVICFAMGYIIQLADPAFYYYLELVPGPAIWQGQWWRFFTWIFTAPSTVSWLTIFALFCYYLIGRQLEMAWGKFMFNLYIFGQIILMDLSVLVGSLILKEVSTDITVFITMAYAPVPIPYYVSMTMFLAFAVLYGEETMYLMMLIPFKAKWIAYIDGIYLAYCFIAGNAFSRIIIVAGVANFLIFFFINRGNNGRSFTQLRNARHFNSVMKGKKSSLKRTVDGDNKVIRPEAFKNRMVHKCAICGRTEDDSEYLEFRYCSKCNGNYEYCSDHLYTHEHIQ